MGAGPLEDTQETECHSKEGKTECRAGGGISHHFAKAKPWIMAGHGGRPVWTGPASPAPKEAVPPRGTRIPLPSARLIYNPSLLFLDYKRLVGE